MYLLATHPEELRRAQREVDEIVADPSGATVEEIRKLQKTRWRYESMRFHPAPPILIRRWRT